MRTNRLFYFNIFLIITIMLSSYVLTVNSTPYSVLLTSIYYLIVSVVYFFKNYAIRTQINSFDIFTLVSILLYIVYGIALSLDLMDKIVYNDTYPIASTIVLSASIIQICTLSIYFKNIDFTIKYFLILIVFLLFEYFFISSSLTYIFYSSDNIVRPLYTSISLSMLSACILFFIVTISNNKIMKFRNIYIFFIILYMIISIIILFLFIFELPENHETNVPFAIIILIISVLINLFTIKKLFKSL